MAALALFFAPAAFSADAAELLNPQERAWLNAHGGRVKLAVERNYAPFVFLDAEGQATGLAEDYIRLIELKLGVRFQRRAFESLADIFESVRAGEVQIVNAVTETAWRREFLSFTEPFITVPNVILVHKDLAARWGEEDLAERKVALVRSYAVTEYLTGRGAVRAPEWVASDLDAILSVSLQRAEAAVIDLATASYLISRKKIPNLRVAGEVNYPIALAIACDKREPMLHRILQKGLQAATETEKEEILQRWIGPLGRYYRPDWRIWFGVGIALSIILAVTAVVLVWNRVLRGLVSVRTRELADEKDFVSVTLDSIVNGVICTDLAGRVTRLNPAAAKLCGWTAEEALSHPVTEVLRLLLPQSREPLVLPLAQTLESAASVPVSHLATLVSRSGEEHQVIAAAAQIRGGAGAPLQGGVLVIQDVTEQQRAEAEREKLAAQLLQAQKMESIGRLAGGIAHDFNNMLGVILGHTELMLEQLDPQDPNQEPLREIRKAAEQSANLTRQLLAFARRQSVAPQVLDLNETVSGMLKMLERLIGENILLVWRPAAGLWRVKADPSQIDRVLANLCANARDAIRDSGRITIETSNSAFDEVYCASHSDFLAGEFVRLSVRDDGSGMSPETLDHIFEPFFTTKDVGAGTGLGLSTVYGIVKQNQGFISVRSEPGKGTTLDVYLPRYRGEAEAAALVQPSEPAARGQETILLVEDEPGTLKLISTMLKRQGYSVLAANTPSEAIRLADKGSGDIHLLITDLVMPGMNGRDVAARVSQLRPSVKCLFMSGYADDVVAHHGLLDHGVQFIQKPFAMRDLAAAVRKVLDSPHPSAGTGGA